MCIPGAIPVAILGWWSLFQFVFHLYSMPLFHVFGRTHDNVATVCGSGGVAWVWYVYTSNAYGGWYKVGGLKLVGSSNEAWHTRLVVLWPKGQGPSRAISVTVLYAWNTEI